MLSKQLESTLRLALSIAHQNHHEYATFEHLLLALLDEESVIQMMDSYKIDVADIHKKLVNYIDNELDCLVNLKVKETKPSAGFQRIVHRSAINVNAAGWKTVVGVNLLAEFFLEDDTYAIKLLKGHGLNRSDILTYISKNVQSAPAHLLNAIGKFSESESSSESKTSVIDDFIKDSPKTTTASKSAITNYCVDLNAKAGGGGIDSLIGREAEVQRTIEILCRRQKNNAVLVGEPGVGKTAIAEGLALRIVRKDVPQILLGCTIYALDLGSLVAGTRYRGDFEERIKSLVQEFRFKKDAILFVDEIHTMIGAGATAGGSLDASNLLKPALARGEIRCIGSTTFKEFRDHFEKDPALVRRFQKVVVNEPDEEATLNILKGVKSYYEHHHGVKYDSEALQAAVHLSERYITDKHLPDKAIDLMDEAGSRKKVFGKNKTVTQRDIEEIVAMVARLPSVIVAVDDLKKLQKLESNLKKTIFGQDEAIEELCSSIKLAKAGLQRTDRPTGCYLFAGNTGVGKTELARQLAECCSMELIRFDMSEYSESNTVSRLIGTPPGYVGFEQGGLLTEAVSKSPYSVVLFDEMEKADREIYNLLLQVMDNGILTDSTGKEINFCHTIIIMTTNAGSEDGAFGSIGFNTSENHRSSKAMSAIFAEFSPEFRSRLDSVIIFNPLSTEMMKLIIDKGLKELAEQLADRGVKLDINGDVKHHLINVGFDKNSGARILSRIINTEIKEPIADEILFGKLKKGGTTHIDCSNGELRFSFESRSKAKTKVLAEA